MVVRRDKRWKLIHVWVDEDMKRNVLYDVDRGEERNLSQLIRKLLREHHEKVIRSETAGSALGQRNL